jgi:hypothetical protein
MGDEVNNTFTFVDLHYLPNSLLAIGLSRPVYPGAVEEVTEANAPGASTKQLIL